MTTKTQHRCDLRGVWPTGHPLPAEDPLRLEGPQVGEVRPYVSRHSKPGSTAVVVERSYVWSPGECRHGGGYRHYDWSVVIVTEPGQKPYRIVVNDTDLVL